MFGDGFATSARLVWSWRPSALVQPPKSPSSKRKDISIVVRRNVLIAASIAAVAMAAIAAFSLRQASATSPSPTVQFVITPGDGRDFGLSPLDCPFAISPSGDEVAFVSSESLAGGSRRDQLMIRMLNRLDFVPVAGTDGARFTVLFA